MMVSQDAERYYFLKERKKARCLYKKEEDGDISKQQFVIKFWMSKEQLLIRKWQDVSICKGQGADESKLQSGWRQQGAIKDDGLN